MKFVMMVGIARTMVHMVRFQELPSLVVFPRSALSALTALVVKYSLVTTSIRIKSVKLSVRVAQLASSVLQLN